MRNDSVELLFRAFKLPDGEFETEETRNSNSTSHSESQTLSDSELEPTPLDDDSAFALLKDIRVVVFLVSLVVVTMTATLLLLRDDTPGNPNAVGAVPGAPVQESGAEARRGENKQGLSKADAANQVGGPQSTGSTVKKSSLLVQQDADFSFDLSIRNAVVAGCKKSRAVLSGWQSEGEASWLLGISDRRSGFFECRVSYRAKEESLFSIQMGELAPRKFTLYPKDEDFTEYFIVRLPKEESPVIKLKALDVGDSSEVIISKVELRARK